MAKLRDQLKIIFFICNFGFCETLKFIKKTGVDGWLNKQNEYITKPGIELGIFPTLEEHSVIWVISVQLPDRHVTALDMLASHLILDIANLREKFSRHENTAKLRGRKLRWNVSSTVIITENNRVGGWII